MIENLKVFISRKKCHDLLSNNWLWKLWGDIKPMMSPSFFAEEKVVYEWLKTLPPEHNMLLSFLYKDEEIIGVAIFGEFIEFVGKIVPVKKVSLLRTGNPKLDQWWPEYVQPRLQSQSEKHWAYWMEKIIKETKADFLDTEVIPLKWLGSWRKECENLNLEVYNIESGGVRCLNEAPQFSKSVLRQCKQTSNFSKKKWGTLSLEKVDKDTKKIALKHYGLWHVKKWSETSTKSGFENVNFRNLLNGLSELSSDVGINIYLAYAGEDVVGMQIVLYKGDWAAFYLSSLLEDKSNHWHLGTWMHTEVINDLKKDGFTKYDFMAGEARYKKQLSTDIPFYAKGEWSLNCGFRITLLRCLKKAIYSGNIIKRKLINGVIYGT